MKNFSIHQPAGRMNLLRAAGTVLALGLLVYLLAEQGWGEIVAAIRGIALWRLVLAFVLMMVSRFIVSARWYFLLRAAGVEITPGQALRINFAGLFANNFLLGTVGGDVIRLAGALQLKYDAAICTASLIADRLVGMAGMMVVVPFGLPRFLESRGWALSLLDGELLAGRPPLSAAGLASLSLGDWWRKLWEKGLRIARRLMEALVIWLKRPSSLVLPLLLTWAHMICLFAFLALIFDGMGEHMPFLLIGGLYSLVYFVTLLPISINGYGLQEISMTLIFSSLGGASVAAGISAAVLFRTLMMLASLPGVAFVPGMIPGGKKPA